MITEASIENIRQQSQVLESMGHTGKPSAGNEAAVSTLTALREDQDKATQMVLERVVALERVTQKLRVHDEKIRAELDPVLQADGGHNNAGAHEAAKAKGKPQKAVRFEAEGITSPRPSNMKPDTFAINTAEIGKPEGDGGGQANEYQDLGRREDPPGLEAPGNFETWKHKPPPTLPPEVSKSGSSSSSTHCQWKLIKQFPKIEKPVGQAWERGLQLGQHLTEMAQIAACVHAKFGAYVQALIKAAQRYNNRLEEGFSNLETLEVPANCAEYESRFSMALLGSVDPDIKKDVVEAALGQAVSSFQMLIAVL